MLTYEDAGVDRKRAHDVVERIDEMRRQAGMEKSSGEFAVGGFAAGFVPEGYDEPVVFATCDGIGTKSELLIARDRWETAGRDLVAVNVNDVLAAGALPHLFLDYVAMERLATASMERLVAGMIDACLAADCALGGGETAEMPGVARPDSVELVGFCVGVAERSELRQTPPIRAGDAVFGVPSNGFHANGYSLIRRILSDHPDIADEFDLNPVLAPVRIYLDEVQTLVDCGVTPSAMVHVTGGGIRHNLRRVLPDGLHASLRLPDWRGGVVEAMLSHVDPQEAHRTFNMGIGWIFVVSDDQRHRAAKALPDALQLGEITGGKQP